MGLVDALVAMILILVASMAIFGGITFFSRSNAESVIHLASVQAAMEAWASTPTKMASPTVTTQSYDVSVNVRYTSATSGTQSISIPVAMSESGASPGWSKVATE
jgi:uncharacterized membrane protein